VTLSKFSNALKAASHETTRLMSARLRSEAQASGWPSEVSRTLRVTHGKSGFEAHVSKKHYEKALDLEYGTPDTQPTAAVRRFKNRQAEAEHFFLGRLEKHFGDL